MQKTSVPVARYGSFCNSRLPHRSHPAFFTTMCRSGCDAFGSSSSPVMRPWVRARSRASFSSLVTRSWWGVGIRTPPAIISSTLRRQFILQVLGSPSLMVYERRCFFRTLHPGQIPPSSRSLHVLNAGRFPLAGTRITTRHVRSLRFTGTKTHRLLV